MTRHPFLPTRPDLSRRGFLAASAAAAALPWLPRPALAHGSEPFRLTVGATEVETGNFRYFDSRETRIGPEHILASGALPPAFPAVEIEGKQYWDGGLVSNTPLEHVLDEWPRQDTLAFQVDQAAHPLQYLEDPGNTGDKVVNVAPAGGTGRQHAVQV